MNIIYTDKHHLHNTDTFQLRTQLLDFAEVPARAEMIREGIKDLGTIDSPRDFGLDPIEALHSRAFLRYLKEIYGQAAAAGYPLPVVNADVLAPPGTLHRPQTNLGGLIGYYCFGIDEPILEHTWDAAYWSAQCALTAADRVKNGDRVAYALCRPPGHHATTEMYGGFCYLNNAAIAARSLQSPLSQRERGQG